MDGSCGKKDIKENQQLSGSTNSKRRYRNINKYREFYNPNRTIGTRNKRGERMKKDLSDLISRKRIRYELGESTMPKRYRDFCLRVIDSERLTPTVILDTPQEDFRNWIVDNWETAVFDCIGLALSTMVVDEKKDMNDVVDREETIEFISERLQEGLLNVIDTYEVENELQNK